MWLADQPVSVVMPVRDAMPFLDEAIESILAQSHANFEFVIGDDGSTDGSGERLDHWARRDPRIRLVRNHGPCLGPAGSSNWVVREAIHPLIARMDADDVSLPDRLHRQVLAFRAHPNAVIVGSLYDLIDEKSRRVAGRNRSALTDARGDFPVAHGSIMFRRDVFDRVGGYRAQCDFWEDRDLLIRILREGEALILPEALYRYRYSGTSCRLVANEARVARALDFRLHCLAAYQDGRDYDDLIAEEAARSPRTSIAPSVLAQIAIERLWRGDPRTIMQSWTRRHTNLRWDRLGILIRVFAAWARVNPASLRALLKLRARYADWRARNVVADGEVHVWTATRPRRGTGAASPQPGHERLQADREMPRPHVADGELVPVAALPPAA
jgi:glycosyltransferase involved in cell wall biosynthesis